MEKYSFYLYAHRIDQITDDAVKRIRYAARGERIVFEMRTLALRLYKLKQEIKQWRARAEFLHSVSRPGRSREYAYRENQFLQSRLQEIERLNEKLHDSIRRVCDAAWCSMRRSGVMLVESVQATPVLGALQERESERLAASVVRAGHNIEKFKNRLASLADSRLLSFRERHEIRQLTREVHNIRDPAITDYLSLLAVIVYLAGIIIGRIESTRIRRRPGS